MKIGYACLNNSIGCRANSTFRLSSYSEELLNEKIASNLSCLKKIIKYNLENDSLFFRISSETIPFASHPICKFDWKEKFRKEIEEIGETIRKNKIRISMHPDQFVLINAKDEKIIQNSVKEIEWHCDFLDIMKLDNTAKIQIHVGGIYGDKDSAIKRFIFEYKKLPEKIKKRLVIENDDKLYSLKDCLEINKQTNIPIIFDNFHHECLNNGESLKDAINLASKTWSKEDGLLMCDYSSQEPNARKGKHVGSINEKYFEKYLNEIKETDCDIILEIKDKEKSFLKAIKIAKKLKLIK